MTTKVVVTELVPKKNKLGAFQATLIIKGSGCTTGNIGTVAKINLEND